MIPLGAVAQDTISGFEGVVVARTEWLYGCVRLVLQPQELHEGQPVEAQTFDEPQLIQMTGDPVAVKEKKKKVRPGGPRPDPVSHRNVTSR